MRVLLSWSGARSAALAHALREWLPTVIQAVEPWMSESDIDRGARWSEEIVAQLEVARVGIICITPDNVSSPSLHFEAGALLPTPPQTTFFAHPIDPPTSPPPAAVGH